MSWQERGEHVGRANASGRIAVADRFTGTADASACTVEREGAASGLVARFGPGGACEWISSFGGPTSALASLVAFDGSELVAVGLVEASRTEPALVGDLVLVTETGEFPDLVSLRYDDSGSLMAVRQFGSSVTQTGAGLAVMPSGDLVIAGQFMGTINLSGKYATNGGGSEAFHTPADLFVGTFSP